MSAPRTLSLLRRTILVVILTSFLGFGSSYGRNRDASQQPVRKAKPSAASQAETQKKAAPAEAAKKPEAAQKRKGEADKPACCSTPAENPPVVRSPRDLPIRPNPSSRVVHVEKKDPFKGNTRWLENYKPGTPEARAAYEQWKTIGDTIYPRQSSVEPTKSTAVVSHKDFGEPYESDRKAKSVFYSKLRNRIGVGRDANGKLDLVDRDPSLGLSRIYQEVPSDQQEDPDTVRLPVGSFSVKQGSPYGLDAWRRNFSGPAVTPQSFGPVSGNAKGYYVYKFNPSVFTGREQEAKDALTAKYPSLFFAQYIGNYTYLVRANSSDASQLDLEHATRFKEPYRPEYKVLPNVGRIKLPPALAGLRTLELMSRLFAGEDSDAFTAAIRSLGGEIVGVSSIPWPYDKNLWTHNVYFRLDRDLVKTAAAFEGIEWIEEVTPLFEHNQVTPSQGQSGTYGADTDRPYWQAGVDGRTQIGADNGCCTPTPPTAGKMPLGWDNMSFADSCTTPVAATAALNCSARKVVRYQGVTTASALPGGYSHPSETSANMVGNVSTFNASTNPGGIVDPGAVAGCPLDTSVGTDTWPDQDGMARGSKLNHIDIATYAGTETDSMTDVFNDSCTVSGNTAGARIQNRSYGDGAGGEGAYLSDAAEIDTFSFDNRAFLAFTSAGNNDRTVAPCDEIIPSPATAKNDVTVGVSGGPTGNTFKYGFTGGECNNIGPETASSGRVGPTVVNPGASNNTAGSLTSVSYCSQTDTDQTGDATCSAIDTGTQGTSFSSPFTAGQGLLIRDYFQQGFYPTGAVVPANTLSVSGALVKATLIASSDVMTSNLLGQTDRLKTGGTQLWGYGVPILTNALRLNGDSRTPIGMKAYDNQCVVSSAPWIQTLNVVNTTTKPLRIALVWADGPGNALVNNLNLSVTHNGNTYLGNVFSGAFSVTGGSADTQNNMEAVYIPDGSVATGLLTLTVTAATIGTDDPACSGTNNQQFAVFVAGDIVETSSISLNQNEYTCSDSLTVTVNDVTQISSATVSSAVTITTSNGDSEVVPAGNWTGSTCSGGNCNQWVATLPVNSSSVTINNGSLNVAQGATTTATYVDPHGGHFNQQTTAGVNCQASVLDGGYILQGGCDENAAAEKYVQYMDTGELSAYTVGVYNNSLTDLTDARVSLSFSGAGAGAVTILGSSTINIGRIPARTVSGAVFNIQTSAVADLTSLTLDFSVTSPADGYTTPFLFSQTQLLETDDTIVVQSDCRDHNTDDMVNVAWAAPGVDIPWGRTTDAVCSAENRNDGFCGNATIGMYKTGVNSLTVCTQTGDVPDNDNTIASLMPPSPIATINQGIDGGTGQPWRYALRRHSVYGATAEDGNVSIGWGVLYEDNYGSGTQTTDGSDVFGFAIDFCCFRQTFWDSADALTTWDWDVDNLNFDGTTAIPDLVSPIDSNADGLIDERFCGDVPVGNQAAPENQLVLCFGENETGNSTASSFLNYGHVAFDADGPPPPISDNNNQGFGLDNDFLIWEEFHAGNDVTGCGTSGQCGTVSFDKFRYSNYENDTAVITVLDSNASSGFTVTVTSGTGDSEAVTMTGTAPTFTASLTLSHNSGAGTNNGTLYVLPNDGLVVVYNDPENGLGSACTDTNSAIVTAPGGAVIYLSNSVDAVNSSGDADIFPDHNETISLKITIQNNMTTSLTNAYVKISSTDPDVDCIPKDTAFYGTVTGGGGTATNSTSQQFVFHVNPSTDSNGGYLNPEKATFTVYIYGDTFSGSSTVQSFLLVLDLDDPGLPPVTLTEDFDPVQPAGWDAAVGPGDDDAVCLGLPYVNDFHWCALCGNGNGGFGAWVGNGAFNTPLQKYRGFGDSVLYSPPLTAGAPSPTVTFDRAVQAENNFDGAAVQYSINGAAWQYMTFTAPTAMDANMAPSVNFCSPLDSGVMDVWSDNTVRLYGTTDTVAIPALANDNFQVRWRLGSDSTYNYAGYGVDNVTITNVKQFNDDDKDNSGLSACGSPHLVYTNQSAFLDSGCNNNGFVDPGESGVLNLTTDNLGSANATSVFGTLTCPACPGVTICDNSAAYGTENFGDALVYTPTTNTFSIALSAGVACGTILPFQLQLTGSNPYGPVTRTANVRVGTQVSTTTVNFADNFQQDPAGTTGTGRTGFTTPGWVESTSGRVNAPFTAAPAPSSGCGSNAETTNVVQIENANEFHRVFSTVGATNSLVVSWQWNTDQLNAGEQGELAYSTAGAGGPWTTVATKAGAQANAWQCASVDLSAASGVLNNANFGIRFLSTSVNNARDVYIDNFKLTGTALSNSCAATACTGTCPAITPPAVADGNTPPAGTGGTAAKFTKSGGNIVATWDNATCSAGNAIIKWGNIGTFTGYAGDAACNAGLDGTETYADPSPGNSIWFNILWTQGATSGHPGYGTAGARTWTAAGTCSMTSDSSVNGVCAQP